MREQSHRILAQDVLMNNDTWQTGLNNNDLIIGPSGAGKTRGYVKPNILLGNESLIVADTKGSMLGELEAPLREKGFQIIHIDFCDCLNSCGYNPLDYIRYDAAKDKYSEQDIMTIAACIVPLETMEEPFWDLSARMFLESMIAYTLERLPENEHTMLSVFRLFSEMNTSKYGKLFKELGEQDPSSFAFSRYQMYKDTGKANKTYECIRAFLAQKLSVFTFDGARALFYNPNKIRFEQLGAEKTAVFLSISDTDRAMDRLVNLFYTQALHSLCGHADKSFGNRLKVPVRFILDDFAANVCIPDFDKIISVIRSREIYVSVILQSISQLEAMYDHAKALTILNNCDNCLYLGGQDVETARYMSIKANKTIHTILNMPLDNAWLFTRGQEPRQVQKYVPKETGDTPKCIA